MLTFQLNQPFNQQEIHNIVEQEVKKSKLVFKKLQLIGLLIVASNLLIGYFWGIGSSPQEDYIKIMVLFIPMTLGLFHIFYPYLRVLTASTPNLQNEIFEYLPASIVTTHHCEAFVNMPGMEKYKDYVEKVKIQGRSLTNLECQEIINHYESLIK